MDGENNGKPYLKWMIWEYPYFRKHPCLFHTIPKHPMFFFDVFNLLCFSGAYTTISLAVFCWGFVFGPASVTRYPRSSMLLAWLVLRNRFGFFLLLFLLAGFFLAKKNVSILKVKYDVFILMYCKCYNLKYEQIVFNIIIDHY